MAPVSKSEPRVDTQTSLAGDAPAWDALVSSMPLPSPFLRSWWVDHAAQGAPLIVTVRDDGVLIGGLALQRRIERGVEWLSFLGGGPLEPDHLDAVYAPARRRDVIAALHRWLGEGDRVLDLDGLVADSALALALPSGAVTRSVTPSPYVRLPGSYDEYFAGRHGKLRSTVTRAAKRLDTAGVVFRVDPAAGIDSSLEALHSLHDSRWGDESGFLAAWDGFAASMRAGARAGEVTVSSLVGADGAPIAVELELQVGKRLCFYQAGRLTDHEWRGSGSVLKARIVERAITDGVAEFDLLRGGEPYKAEWAVAARTVRRVQVGTGLRSRGLLTVAAARRRHTSR